MRVPNRLKCLNEQFGLLPAVAESDIDIRYLGDGTTERDRGNGYWDVRFDDGLTENMCVLGRGAMTGDRVAIMTLKMCPDRRSGFLCVGVNIDKMVNDQPNHEDQQ